MSEKFLTALKKEDNFTETTNGAVALKSTHSSLVDLFGSIGSMRTRSVQDIEDAFSKAFAEDKLLAMKLAFYSRNCRSGLGEKRVFATVSGFLAKTHPDIIAKNVKYIPFFGRFDDLYAFVGTAVEDEAWEVIKNQLKEDLDAYHKGKPISLIAKWLKSCNTSSKQSNYLGKLTAKKLGYSEKDYRQMLSALRKHIDVVECKMSGNLWETINYEGVPSKAMNLYRNAFPKHDKDGFEAYIESVKSGEAKINAATLFPYDILEKMCSWQFNLRPDKYDEVLEQQWKALPNYIEGENNVLIMADTSGSMNGRPMATSVGLAMYFAERNHGIFKDVFMTFSSKPSFVQLKGDTVYEKIKCIPAIVQNTDLEAAFRLILETAVRNNLSSEDMPKSLCVISDMQFDRQTTNPRMTWHDAMVETFLQNGYEMPNIIYWNVNSTKDTFQVTSNYNGVQLASGQSPAVFKSILNNIGKTPYEAMVSTLSNPIYDVITI